MNQLAGLLCVLLVAVPIGLLIGAVFLRAACSLYNRFAGATPGRPQYREADDDDGYDTDTDGPRGVPEPTIGRAVLIVLASGVVNWVISFVIQMGIITAGSGAGLRPQDAQILAVVVSLPVTFAVFAAVLAAMLPTTFVRGLLVTLILHVLYFILAGVIIAIAVAVFGGLAVLK